MKHVSVLLASLVLAACATQAPRPAPATTAVESPAPQQPAGPGPDDLLQATVWTQLAVEHDLIFLEVYRDAKERLLEALRDPSWDALPHDERTGPVAGLEPAVVLDVDETVLDNSPFQVLLGDKPFNRGDWDQWVARADAEPLPGAVEFIARAQAAGVQVFLVTNRDCMRRADSGEACPQEADTLANLRRVGVSTDAEHLLLSNERPEWTDEKMVRRQFVARYYRVIMVFGDDLGDFLDCARARVIPPCTRPATAADRLRAISEYEEYWGRGWFVLPNPMYGSWTSVR